MFLNLASIFESARKHPGKLQALYYNMPSTLSEVRSLSQSSISQNEQSSHYEYNEDPVEKLLLDEAEQLYNKIVEAYANKCINEITNDTESSSQTSQILQVPDVQHGLSTDEGYHTSANASLGEISINSVLNDFALQICHSLNITNERNSGTAVRLREDESDTCNFLQDQQE
jgi:hypothetical protein